MVRTSKPLRLTAGVLALLALVAPLVCAQSSSLATTSRTSLALSSTYRPAGNNTASSTGPAPPLPSTTLANATALVPSANTTASKGPQLHTHVDATFGILGGILVVSSVPLGFWGGKNRW